MELILTDHLRIRLPEQNKDGTRNELGNRLWTAAVMLSGVLRSQEEFLRDKKVLEIGAGLGLCGFCTAALGASSTTITDCGSQTLNQLSETLVEYQKAVQLRHDETHLDTLSGTQQWEALNIRLRRHLWEEDLEYLESKSENRPIDPINHWSKVGKVYQDIPVMPFDETFDVIIGSDLLYFSSQERPLLAAIQLRLRKDGMALILQTMRTNNVSVFSRFVEAAQRIFHVEVKDIRPDDVVCDVGRQQQGINETPHTTGYKLVVLRFLPPC